MYSYTDVYSCHPKKIQSSSQPLEGVVLRTLFSSGLNNHWSRASAIGSMCLQVLIGLPGKSFTVKHLTKLPMKVSLFSSACIKVFKKQRKTYDTLNWMMDEWWKEAIVSISGLCNKVIFKLVCIIVQLIGINCNN